MNIDPLSGSLRELALDLRWAWNHAADELWRQLDPELWDLSGNAWFVLQAASKAKLEAAGSDPAFQRKLNALIEERKVSAAAPGWFQQTFPGAGLKAIAYFSLEFMLSDALPIYSGGLGNVAGDQLKAAGDLGVPVVGIGLLYQRGYFRQQIDAQGWQQALYPFNDPAQLPIAPALQANGDRLVIEMNVPGFRLRVRVWQAQVGRAKLYLLDTNDPSNLPEYRGITSELYGGSSLTRLQQERVLGIAGWRLLRALGIDAEVCHLNEGHAAFAVLERARAWVEDHKQPFEIGLAATRAGNIFTTHTPVEAGFDRFAPDLMEAQFRQYAEAELGIPFAQLMTLGRANPDDNNEPFNMAYLAVRGSGGVNGVSRLHGEVSRGILQNLFPRWPHSEVPVGSVTNGVHFPTWDSIEADELWTGICGKARWKENPDALEAGLRRVPDAALWTMRTKARKGLVDYIRQRLSRQLAGHGASQDEVQAVERIFDPGTLTIGFARRFATYKRPNLLLRDPDRLLRILTNRQRPVQLILAGKAHPQDGGGQEMIRQWIRFIRDTPARAQAVFLSDYDMRMTEHLVQGVDLWLNTPRRPWEASGTSGMKVLVNGGLNLSELDGWWAEAYTPDVGWALGDGREHHDDAAVDAAEADRLYSLLEQEIAGDFYTRDEAGIPTAWVRKMRESMARLTPEFSAGRTVREYTSQYYVPAAKALRARADDGAGLVDWRRHLAQHWGRLRFEDLQVETANGQHIFKVRAYLDEMPPNAVRLEIYAEAQGGGQPVRETMNRGGLLPGSASTYIFTASVPAGRPAGDFTPRFVPFHPHAAVPLEAQQILWYR